MSGDPRQSQLPPQPGQDLTGFPEDTLRKGTEVYRSHRSRNDHNWYSTDGAGRFDLPSPRGTTYVADSIKAAVREGLGVVIPGTVVTSTEADKRTVTRLEWLTDSVCANVSHDDADDHGVSSELTASREKDYSVPMAWAAALEATGFAGIRYCPRFSTGTPKAWALFGTAGAHDVGRAIEVIPGAVAYAAAGIRVVAPPAGAAVRRISTPPGSTKP